MAKRRLSLIALISIFAVLYTVVAHACAAFGSIQAVVQAPCDHDAAQNENRGKPEKDNCDSVRYSLLSIQASSAEPDFSRFYSTGSLTIVFLDFAAIGSPALLSARSQAPPFSGLEVSPHLSHVILRI